ncbi:hypothetical protein [Dethiobacter alkaliphilus]|uniref:hypothetical protein n=1 Tax=Dethiobacter alkaliphilus TaxID=427926 RepID=UPI002225EFD1|nr:hypothetical protein [Dethiobacter alkaliphilus]MCW3490814.1 hypothetical protein [Dethiobacter alkaliphilus]
MKLKQMITILFVLLFLTGCNDLFSFNTIGAIEQVSAAYNSLFPGEGKVRVLYTEAYRGGMLVLAQHETAADSRNLHLFLVDKDGVLLVAGGKAAEPDSIAVSQVRHENDTIVFGQIDSVLQGDEHPALPIQAVMTLKNWKIIEEEIDVVNEQGFIFVLRNRASAQKFSLLDAEGTILVGLDGMFENMIYDTEFIAVEDIPNPVPLELANIKEVQVESPGMAEVLILDDTADYKDLAETFNEHFSHLKKKEGVTVSAQAVTVYLSDKSEVILQVTKEETVTVIYRDKEQINAFALDSEKLAEIIADLQSGD